jgi:hypothetical protein
MSRARIRARHLIAASGESIAFFFVHPASFLSLQQLPSITEATQVFLAHTPITTPHHQFKPHISIYQNGFRERYVFDICRTSSAFYPCHDLPAPIESAHFEKQRSWAAKYLVVASPQVYSSSRGGVRQVAALRQRESGDGLLGYVGFYHRAHR